MRLVVPDPLDRILRHEHVDVDRPRAFERDRFQFLVLQDHVFAVAALVSPHLLVLVDRLAGLGIDVPALQPVACLSIERSEEHTSELQSLMRISYAVFCLKNNKNDTHIYVQNTTSS